MKKSVRAMRMERQHKRMARESKLSLVSLMDIFTILVFFLMFNASDVQVLQTHKSVTLPASTADRAAQENLVLLVNNREVLLQGQHIADVNTLLTDQDIVIPALKQELDYHRTRSPAITTEGQGESFVGAITIMGDQAIPYALLKKIMQTCAQAGYSDISLAVEHQPRAGEAS